MASAAAKETDLDRDDISVISSMSTKTTSSADFPPPSYSTLSSMNIHSAVVEEISNYLELECNDKRDEIIFDLMMNGRRALYKYRQDIIPEILSQEDDCIAEGQSPLLKLIKRHITGTWETFLVNEPTIIAFINDVKKENSIHFDNVLSRIAEHGSTYTGASSILSIVLQLLSESLDDESFMKTNKFTEIWNSITIEGIQGIRKASQDIPEEELEEQINNKKSPLYLALRLYYQEEMKKLFSKHRISNRHNTLYDLARDNVTESGWLKGIESIKKKVAGTQYNLLMQSVQLLIENQLSTSLPKVTIGSDNTDHSGNGASSNNIPSCELSNTTSALTSMSSIPAAAHPVNVTHDPPSNVSRIQSATQAHNESINDITSISASQKITNITAQGETTEQITMKNKDFNDEIDLIMGCIKQNSLSLENLIEAGEFIYVDKTFKDISNDIIRRLNKENPNLTKFIEECRIPIMFLLKRQQSLDDFISILTITFEDAKSDESLSTTFKINLRTFVHVLLLNSDIFLSRTIMSLISKRNPVPFVEPNIQSWNLNNDNNVQYKFIPSIIHVWDHTRPTILSFGIGNDCRGKSSLLNVLFQSTFEQSVSSIYFQQTIDIDFGYSFNPERQLNIADCHGQMSIDLLTKIRPLFDGYLIHINMQYLKQHSKEIIEYLELLPRNKFYFILVRDITSSSSSSEIENQYQKLIDSSDTISSRRSSILPLVNMSITTDREIQRIIQRIRNQILKSVDNQKDMLVDTEVFQNCMEKLLTKDYVSYLNDINDIIQPLKKHLLSKDSDDPNRNNFPLYLKFIKLCELHQELKKIDFYGSKSENKFNINQQIYMLENESNPDSSSSENDSVGFVFKKFIKILKNDHMLMSLNLLSSELRHVLLSHGGDKLANNLAVSKSFLSLEVIWRNAIVCYSHASPADRKLILQSYIKYIEAGFPFEIIDGDHFYLQQAFLTEVMQHFGKQRILVISIIGPQNSGKSTLLNYMFGTLFEVREGRCTRGVYGSFVKCKNIPNIDYIMLIDTEGLLSIEKSDKEYDRRLILFCLGVSHLVIVNMLGDINETLKDMLTLCTDSLKRLDVGKVPKPTVHFVLNQKADPNIKNHLEAINKIVSDLKDQDLAETIDIGADTFHTLPSAFKRERLSNDTTGPCLLRTEPDFIELAQKLVSKITLSAKQCYSQEDTTNFTPRQWISTSITIFETLQRFPDLTYFKDINEKRQDNKIRKQIEELLSKTLPSTYRQKLIQEHCDKNELEIRKSFQSKFQDHQQKLKDELENIFLLENASDRIRDRCQQFLERQVTEIMNAWCTAAIQASDQQQMELLVRDGAADLKKLIDLIIEKGETLTKHQATDRFENMWNEKVEFIRSNFNAEERLKQAIKFVYGNYNIFERTSLSAPEYFLMKKLSIIKTLTCSENLIKLVDSLKNDFSSDVMGHRERVIQQPNNSKFTLSTIENFVYLNKGILSDKSYAMREYNFPPITAPAENKPGFVQRQVDKLFKVIMPITPHPLELKPLDVNLKQSMKSLIMSELQQLPFHPANVLQLTVFFDTIYNQLLNLIKDENVIRPVEIDIIQKIVGVINTVIGEINLELAVFELSLSRNISSTIHSNVVLLLTLLHYHEQKRHFDKQLETLAQKKPGLLNFFISMVVPDASTDKDSGEIFVSQVFVTIKEFLTAEAYTIIAKALQTQQDITRKELQKICDGKLQTENKEYMLNYITNPTDLIVEEFKIKWKDVENVIESQIRSKKIQLQKLIYDFFDVIRPMLASLSGKGSSVQFIDELFTSSAGVADENLKNKGQCMMLLFYAYLTNEKVESGMSYTVFNSTYTITHKGIHFFQNLLKLDPSLAEFFVQMKTKSTVTSIKSFQVFLESILTFEQLVHKHYTDLATTFASYDKDQTYIKSLDKARGCTAICPCCRRPCDADHKVLSNPGDEDNKHSCSTGHQLRAFSGIKLEVSNEASLYQCNEINDNDYIVVKGMRQRWSEMKLFYPAWDFDLVTTANELTMLKSKFLYVWSKVGKTFCKQYDMDYVEMNTPRAPPESYHYILLLDSSGSMMGDRWKNLVAGVNKLIEARKNNGTDDRITIIIFSSKANFFCVNKTVKEVDTGKIVFTGGGTDFGPPFDLVLKTLDNTSTIKSNLKYIIVFMSDGEANYPESQLNSLAAKADSQIKEFWTVALGEQEMAVLEKVSKKMNGVYKQLKDASELVQAYAEIAGW